jgi:hypothetical protein
MADKYEDLHAGLTAEEIAELEAEGTGKTEEEDEPAKAAAEKEAADKAAAEAEAAKAAAGETEKEADEGPTEVAAPLRAKAPEKAEEAIAAIRAEEEELATKFDDGEITAREFRDGLNKLGERREELNWSKRKAELAGEMSRQAQENAWHAEVRDFMTTTGANIAKSKAAMIAFDEVVKAVTADPANQKLSDRAQLDKAFKLFMDDVGGALGAKVEAPAPKPKGEAAVKKERVVPPTLAKMPAAEPESTDGGKYAALDRLAISDPLGYEKAIAKMSETEQAEYLRSA